MNNLTKTTCDYCEPPGSGRQYTVAGMGASAKCVACKGHGWYYIDEDTGWRYSVEDIKHMVNDVLKSTEKGGE